MSRFPTLIIPSKLITNVTARKFVLLPETVEYMRQKNYRGIKKQKVYYVHLKKLRFLKLKKGMHLCFPMQKVKFF